VSCSFLTSWLCSLNYLSYGGVICGTFYLCCFNCFSYGVVIYGTSVINLATCTTIGIVDGFTLPLIINYAFTSVFSCFLFTLEPEVPPSLTLFFFLRTLIEESTITFFLFSSVGCISSLVLLTLAGGFYGFSF